MLSNDNKGTDTEQRDSQTPRYWEQEEVEKFSHFLHIICKEQYSTLFINQNNRRLVPLLKVFIYGKLHQMARPAWEMHGDTTGSCWQQWGRFQTEQTMT
jgi:hypothetical protein